MYTSDVDLDPHYMRTFGSGSKRQKCYREKLPSNIDTARMFLNEFIKKFVKKAE